MFMVKMSILLSTLLMLNLYPMLMVISILIFSSMMMMVKWMESSNPWMPLIFTLAFLGGMLIIFMYIVSISKTKTKKNKNKTPAVFVFVAMVVWNVKYGSSSMMTYTIMSSFFSQYLFLCFLIMLILLMTTKIINSPFKALKGAS